MLKFRAYIHLAFGPQSGSGFSGNLDSFNCLDLGFASSITSNIAVIFGSFDNMALAGDNVDFFFFSETGCNFSQHLKTSQRTANKFEHHYMSKLKQQ